MMVSSRRSAPAFTLLELLGVLFLGGLLISLLAPLISRRRSLETWDSVQDHLNQVMVFARQEALTKRKLCRVVFQHVTRDQDSIFVEEEYPDPDEPQNAFKRRFRPVTSDFIPMPLMLSAERRIRAVYRGKENILPEPQGQAYAYVIPDGLVQEVSVHVVKTEEKIEELAVFDLNPFLGTFERRESQFKQV